MRASAADVTEPELDAVLGVHVRGTIACCRYALSFWRDEHAAARTVHGSVVNTISEAALVSLPIYSLYSAAKAAVAQFTLVASREAGEYGVRVNAYAPRALTRMTPGAADIDRSVPHPLDESNSSTLVAWLLSGESSGVTGRLFQTVGGAIALRPMWSPGEILWPPPGRSRFEAAELSDVLAPIIGSGALPDAILVPPGRPKPAWIALSCRSNLTRTTSSY